MLNQILYYTFTRYYLTRYIIEGGKLLSTNPPSDSGPASVIGTQVEEKFMRITPDNNIEWVDSPAQASCIGILSGIILTKRLQRANAGKNNYRFSLVTVADAAFIHHVTTGERI